MKNLTSILKYFSLVLLIVILLKLTKHFGDYKQTVYDIILIPIVNVLILVHFFILYQVQKKTKNYSIIKVIFITGFIGLAGNIILNSLAQNREILSVYEVKPKVELTLYKNQTFQVAAYSPHIFQYWNGDYIISYDTLVLKNIDFEKMPHLRLSQKYIYDKDSENYIGSEVKLIKKQKH